MPATTLAVTKLRLNWIKNERELFHRYGDELKKRGFSMQHPIDLQRDPANQFLTLTQEPLHPDVRVPNTDPELLMYLRRCQTGDFHVIPELHRFLVARNDDRAAVLESCRVNMPENAGMVTAGFGSRSGTIDREPDEPMVPWEHVANWQMCQAALLLFSVRNEPLP